MRTNGTKIMAKPIPYFEYIFPSTTTGATFVRSGSTGSISKEPSSTMALAVRIEYSVSMISICPFALNRYSKVKHRKANKGVDAQQEPQKLISLIFMPVFAGCCNVFRRFLR